MKKLLYILLVVNCSLLIVKAQPTQEWVARYSGLQSSYGSSGYSVKLDSASNVYVLVKVATDSSFGDYGVLKYNPSGSLIWSAYYNSPGNLSEQSHAFVVTANGDVYVTGNSGINSIYHVLTVKFNTNGIYQWASVYNGGGPGDDAYDIALDKQGNISVTGGTATANGSTSYSLTIKYNSMGDTLWTRKFTQLGVFGVNVKLVTDDSGNVYTTGYYEPDANRSFFLTLKYNSSGILMWYSTYFYDPGYQQDLANCIAIDTNRNVYVAGLSHTLSPGYDDNSLLKISPNGIIQWAKVYKGIGGNNQCGQPAGVGVTLDGSSIYYTTFCENGMGGGASDIITLKYNFLGDTIWTRRYGGGVAGTQNAPAALKLDKSNNVYISGMANFPTSGDNYVTIKYLPNGIQQWVATYNGPLTNSEDIAHDLIIDTDFNVYVTGISSRQNQPQFLWDAATIKYNQIIGISPISNQLPQKFVLAQNYPNPFNGSTIITYELPRKSKVELKIYNSIGQLVKTLVNSEQSASYYTVILNTENMSSGVYFYSLISDNVMIETKKFILIK